MKNFKRENGRRKDWGPHLTCLIQTKRAFRPVITADYALCFMKYYYDILIATGVVIVVLENEA
jgi:hypothetical protein